MSKKGTEPKVNTNLADNAVTWLVALLFYAVFAFKDGVILCVDSPSYIEMGLSREPLYPTFLALLRNVFHGSIRGTDAGLWAAVILQSLLFAYATATFTVYVRDNFGLTRIISYIPLCIFLGVSLLCRFAAGRGSMYSNCILSEGIAIPLFWIFIRRLYDFIADHSVPSFLISGIVSFLLISTRKQMYLTLILLFLAAMYVFVRMQQRGFGGVAICILTALAVLGLNYGFDVAYHMNLNGEKVTHFNDNRFLTTVCFYCSDKTDGERIEDDGIRFLFDTVYDACDAEGDMMHSAPDTMFGLAEHFAAHYDRIQIDHMWPMTEYYVSVTYTDHIVSEYEDENVRQEALTDNVMSQINRALLPAVYPRMIRVIAANFLQGLVNTTAKEGGVFNTVGLIMWSIFAALYVIVCARSRGRRSRGRGNTVRMFASLTLMSSIFNILVVGSVIFCQTRYMIYNMPVFYTALVIMGADIIFGYSSRR